MNIQPVTDRAERGMRAVLFLALMLGVGWAMAGGDTPAPMALLAGMWGH